MEMVARDRWNVPSPCRQCGGDMIEMIVKDAVRLRCGTCGLPADAVLTRELARTAPKEVRLPRTGEAEVVAVGSLPYAEPAPEKPLTPKGGRRRE